MLNVQKTHSFSNTVHYCRSSMPRLSQTLRFLQSLLLTSAVCSYWPTDSVHCDWPNTTSTLRKCIPLSIIASFSFQNECKDLIIIKANNVLSFTISSSLRGEQSGVTDTVMMLECVKPWLRQLTPLLCVNPPSLSLTHSLTHSHATCTLCIYTVNSKYLN